DTPVYTPDGKEIIARDNEVSLLRKEDPAKAYFGCHTDITIPYDELGQIEAVHADGSRTTIIENGRFVLPGTEVLNVPLDEE
ncbi:MAG: leucyl aminopeptidase, partial [Lachnospiraceae bacterium]